MTGNNEVQLLHEINSKMVTLMQDFNEVVQALSELTIMVYDKEIDKCKYEDGGFRLRSHM